MIYLLLIYIFSYLFALTEGRRGQVTYIVTVAAGMLLVVASAAESEMMSIPLLKSDEFYYFESALTFSFDRLEDPDRLFWILVNFLVISDAGVASQILVKLINIPVFVVFQIAVYKMTGRNRSVLYMSLLLPYLLWMSTFNYRDILIMTIPALIFLRADNRKVISIVLVAVLLTAMYMLRPVAAAIMVIFVFFYYLTSSGQARLFWRGVIPLILIGAYYGGDYFISKFIAYREWMLYLAEHGQEEVAEQPLFGPDGLLSVGQLALGVLRYFFTPLPSSLIDRIFSDQINIYGRIDDLIRAVHQTAIMAMSGYVFMHARIVGRVLGDMPRRVNYYLAFLAVNVMIYVIYNGGVSHTRIKLSGHVLLFLIFCGILIRKRIKRRRGEPECHQEKSQTSQCSSF